MSTVREAMVSNPGQLPADASAQAAGELLQRPEVRAVYVTQDERLVGVVTRKTLVREVVAAGREPGVTPLGAIAVPDRILIAPGLPKTRSGKIMRRILRKIAAGETDDLGDVTTLADPAVVEKLVAAASG